ncbi:MAG: hypothetical protein IPN69_11210 [Acidobacteria bacterium]|nr:hypothetical protein [Acidobacteriota bacterium]
MNVTEPVVLTDKFVKVLLFIVVFWGAVVLDKRVIAPLEATVWVVLLKSLLLIVTERVELPPSSRIPNIGLPTAALLTEILLLLKVLVIVPVVGRVPVVCE